MDVRLWVGWVVIRRMGVDWWIVGYDSRIGGVSWQGPRVDRRCGLMTDWIRWASTRIDRRMIRIVRRNPSADKRGLRDPRVITVFFPKKKSKPVGLFEGVVGRWCGGALVENYHVGSVSNRGSFGSL